jgi:hypothetical protein
MGQLVVMGAVTSCSMGTGPCTMIVPPANKVMGCNVPAANIMDNKISNLPSFIMCTSMSNPTVASATSAASGVLTPMPCVPALAAPWSPGASKTKIANMPALDSSSTLQCSYGGTISISYAGEAKITVS